MEGFMEKVVFSFERQGRMWCTEMKDRKKIQWPQEPASMKKGKSRECRTGSSMVSRGSTYQVWEKVWNDQWKIRLKKQVMDVPWRTSNAKLRCKVLLSCFPDNTTLIIELSETAFLKGRVGWMWECRGWLGQNTSSVWYCNDRHITLYSC